MDSDSQVGLNESFGKRNALTTRDLHEERHVDFMAMFDAFLLAVCPLKRLQNPFLADLSRLFGAKIEASRLGSFV